MLVPVVLNVCNKEMCSRNNSVHINICLLSQIFRIKKAEASSNYSKPKKPLLFEDGVY